MFSQDLLLENEEVDAYLTSLLTHIWPNRGGDSKLGLTSPPGTKGPCLFWEWGGMTVIALSSKYPDRKVSSSKLITIQKNLTTPEILDLWTNGVAYLLWVRLTTFNYKLKNMPLSNWANYWLSEPWFHLYYEDGWMVGWSVWGSYEVAY